MEFNGAGEMQILTKLYERISFEDRLYEMAKDRVWNSIKFAVMNGKYETTIMLSRDFKDDLIALLKGYGYKVEVTKLRAKVSW